MTHIQHNVIGIILKVIWSFFLAVAVPLLFCKNTRGMIYDRVTWEET